MNTKIFDIEINLYSLANSLIETQNFYTAFFDVSYFFIQIGVKKVELSQKKSCIFPGKINFNESISIRVTPDVLEDANNQVTFSFIQAKLSFYFIHHYGRKSLLGSVTFLLTFLPSEELKLKLQLCQDQHSFVEFRCQTDEIESRAFLRRSSSRESLFKGSSNSIDLGSGELLIESKIRKGASSLI